MLSISKTTIYALFLKFFLIAQKVFTYYNNSNKNSTENWAKIISDCDTTQIRDEGTLFREITMTIDLLKQIVDISDEGIKVSNTEFDKKYYKDLKETARESIMLLLKQPVC